MAEYQSVIVEKINHIATLKLNNPPWNAVNAQLRLDVVAVLQEVNQDKELRVLILTGMGKSFCAGADLKSDTGEARTVRLPPVEMYQNFREWHKIARGLHELEIPTIAMVNGNAIGAGMELALACDIRMGSEKARFKVGFISRGSIPVAGGSWFLPRIVGMHKAFEYAFTDRFIEAGEAEKLGLLNHVFTAQDLEPETKKLADQIAKNPPVAVKLAKLFIRKGLNIDLDSILEFVAPTKFLAFSTEDHRESVAAFREKREPSFRGR
jgi:enoyl-CoA hydratase/carnithine racemase